METMNYEYTKLGDFNEVINYYKKLLGMIEDAKPMQKLKVPNFMYEGLSYDRVLLNNISISIAQSFDYIEKNKPENIDEIILNKLTWDNESSEYEIINERIKEFEFIFKKIMQENNLTAYETLREIRNALLHGDYTINFKSDSSKDEVIIKNYGKSENSPSEILLEGEKEIYLKSGKTIYQLPYVGMIGTLDFLFYNIKAECIKGKREFTTSDERYKTCKNESFLKSYIDSLQSYYIIPKEANEKGNKEQIISRFPALKDTLDAMQRINNTNFFEIKKIPKEEMLKRKKYIESYIRYIGKDKCKYFYLNRNEC